MTLGTKLGNLRKSKNRTQPYIFSKNDAVYEKHIEEFEK
jgi:hypothetical protein